jgi:hypothetical protein
MGIAPTTYLSPPEVGGHPLPLIIYEHSFPGTGNSFTRTASVLLTVFEPY